MPQTKRPASPSPAASSALHDDLLSCTVDAENPLHVEVASEGHFIGVQPRGNLLLSDSGRNDRNTGLGALAALSDQTLLETLLPFLCGRSLACLAGTNKAFYGFIYAADTELWRPLVMDMCGGYFAFQWWWRVTFAEEYKWRRAWQDKQDGTEPGSGTLYIRTHDDCSRFNVISLCIALFLFLFCIMMISVTHSHFLFCLL